MVTVKTCFSFFLTKVEQIQNGGCKLLVNFFAVHSFAAEQTNKQTTTPDNYSSLASSDMFGIIMLL